MAAMASWRSLRAGPALRVVVQFDARAVGELSQRVHEVEVLGLAHPGDLVARRATPKAVVPAFFGVHREGRGLFSVKGAQSGPALARALEGHGLADEGHDVGRRRELGRSHSPIWP